jgi:hypothetical protein
MGTSAAVPEADQLYSRKLSEASHTGRGRACPARQRAQSRASRDAPRWHPGKGRLSIILESLDSGFPLMRQVGDLGRDGPV